MLVQLDEQLVIKSEELKGNTIIISIVDQSCIVSGGNDRELAIKVIKQQRQKTSTMSAL